MPAKTRVVLIQHVLELSQRSNTGRHAASVLPTLETRVYGAKDERLRVDDLQCAVLLWPDAPTMKPCPLPDTLVVLDAPSGAAAVAEIAEPILGFKRGRASFARPAASLFRPGGGDGAPVVATRGLTRRPA
jgi:hypothetical protein